MLPANTVVALAQSCDHSAAEYLLYKYRGLVRNKARSYFLLGADREDIIQVGMIGLWRSIIDYCPEKNVSFLSFARICVERQIISAVKAATRHKQRPLNSALSLNQYVEDTESECTLSEVVASEEIADPEAMVIEAENRRIMSDLIRKMLSDFEWEVLKEYSRGRSYNEIARRLACKAKSVDNALGRIRRKVSLAHDYLSV